MIILLFVLIAILAVLIFFYVRAMADVKKARKEALAHLESCNIRFDNHRVAILEMQDRLRELNSENSLALLSLLKKVDRKANTVFRILVIFLYCYSLLFTPTRDSIDVYTPPTPFTSGSNRTLNFRN